MALILLEGLDRTGKTTVAEFFSNQGYEVIHMSAPSKDASPDAYMGDMVDMLTSFSGRNIVLDRTHMGELIWPSIFNRQPLLNDEDIEILREIEDQLDVTRILMHDNDVDAHWQRCVANKEPLNKAQFLKARKAYYDMAKKYGFTQLTLPEFKIANNIQDDKVVEIEKTVEQPLKKSDPIKQMSSLMKNKANNSIDKLEKANAIKEVLSKPILKVKGEYYSALEKDIRAYLENELNKIFGQPTQESFSKEEVSLLKILCERLKMKENN